MPATSPKSPRRTDWTSSRTLQRLLFDIAFARTGHPLKSEVLIIGDSLTSDIQGGVDYGIDTCWYNLTGEARPEDLRPITYEIKHLRELLEVIE